MKAANAARAVEGSLFQEIMFMNALVLQGKIARLQTIGRVEGAEQSNTPMTVSDALHWFLDDARSFARHLALYREALTEFIRANGIAAPAGTDLDQLLDAIHAVWLHQCMDHSQLNYGTQVLLGDPISPLPAVRPRPEWRAIGDGDVVHASPSGHRYIWRREVLTAEPRDEIEITSDDMAQTERELDCYSAL